MNPADTLERASGHPTDATGTRATSGGVKPAGGRRRVQFYDIVENGRIGVTLTTVHLRLREQFRRYASLLDQRLCQRHNQNHRRSQRVTTSGRKTYRNSGGRRGPVCASFSMRAPECYRAGQRVVRQILVDGIRVNREKKSLLDAAGVPECYRNGGHPLVSEKILQVIQSTKDPVDSLRHCASLCPPTDEMSPSVAAMEIDSAYGHFRRWFIRGIMMGFIRGITLDDHPLRPAKMLVAGTAGGSAGIPDSLGHKPEDTSARAVWSASSHASLLTFLVSRLRPLPSSSLYYSIPYPSFIVTLLCHCHSRARWPAHDRVADLRKPATGAES
jgi:hypothetical protein